tara:strand:- start:220 stop:414 length:195 start_codon:yes stop_codon:yes gene_type:complete
MGKKSLVFLKYNAEEDYMKTPFSVLLYISELENEATKSLSIIRGTLLGVVSGVAALVIYLLTQT